MTDESNLARAVREELQALLSNGPLTEGKASRFSKMASAAANLLRIMEKPSIRGADETLSSASISDGLGNPISGQVFDAGLQLSEPLAYAPAAETFGSRAIRELISTLPMLLNSSANNPTSLVAAIADARQRGMPDVAAELEKKLVGKAIDGDRPVKPAFEMPAPPFFTPTVLSGAVAGAIAAFDSNDPSLQEVEEDLGK